MTDTQITHKRIDKYIPWFFVLMFAIIFVADGVMAFLAVQSQSGVVSETAYKQGIEYNKIIQARKKQDALQWRSTIDFNDKTLVFTLKNKNNNPLSDARVTARLMREIKDGSDFTIPLQSVHNGSYQAVLDIPAKGQWQVRIFAEWHGQHYQASETLVVE